MAVLRTSWKNSRFLFVWKFGNKNGCCSISLPVLCYLCAHIYKCTVFTQIQNNADCKITASLQRQKLTKKKNGDLQTQLLYAKRPTVTTKWQRKFANGITNDYFASSKTTWNMKCLEWLQKRKKGDLVRRSKTNVPIGLIIMQFTSWERRKKLLQMACAHFLRVWTVLIKIFGTWWR